MGSNIRTLRLLRGLTLKALGDRCAPSVLASAISNLEQRDSDASSHASALAAALEIDLELLIPCRHQQRLRAARCL